LNLCSEARPHEFHGIGIQVNSINQKVNVAITSYSIKESNKFNAIIGRILFKESFSCIQIIARLLMPDSIEESNPFSLKSLILG